MRKLVPVLLALLLSGCISFGPPGASGPSLATNLAGSLSVSLQSFAVGDFGLHYADTGEIGRPTIVFIHGTPGSWRSLGRVMDRSALRERARLVSIDRPGWGGSPLPDKEAEGSIAEQVKLIEPLLTRLKIEARGEPLILVGHSYGASMAPYIAYKHPDLVDGLLMAAGAIDPELGKPRWYNHAAAVWPVSRLIDVRLRKANVEIWGVYDALKELEPWWPGTTIPMIYMQGEEDELVDPRNLNFAEEFLPPANTKVVRLPNQGHFVHRQRQELIVELALELLDKTENPESGPRPISGR